MDVLVGSTSAATASCLFLNQNGVGGPGIGVCRGGSEKEDSLSSSSSSSIGAPDDSDDENESKQGSGDVTDSEEVESKLKGGGGGGLTSLGSMDCLEDSLPIKRGLSNYFSGKSKSFASLSDVVTSATTVKELEKRENPFNKRRRVLIASKWSRMSSSSSFYNHPNPKSMPLLTLNEHEDEDQEQEPEETQEDPSSDQSSSDEKEPHMIRTPKLLDRGLKSFKSRSCYCLSDLQQHEQ
ncbi:hypothetical protein M0R45_012205 [Rubus argutus]|uniref:Uncharacterized protein n=1 Tax=Rubus argutus TaxID=59490 RepID=A0AAW1YDM4_RUBAR